MNKKRKFTKRKMIVITILIIITIAIITGISFIINRSIPVKDINQDNISINLSTTRPTGKNIIANISTKTNYDVFYFIDYSAGEEQYYEDEELSDDIEEISENNNDNNTTPNEINNTTNETSYNNSINNTSKQEEKLDIKQISDKEYQKVNDSKFEIQNNGIVYLKYGRFGKLSSTPYVFEISNIDKDGPEIGELETTSTNSSITVTASAIDKNVSSLQYYFKLSTSETYISTGSTNSYTFKDLEKNESYIICVKVADKFGNESEAVTEAIAETSNSSEETPTETIKQQVYHFKVNLGANTVTVYEKDENGKFTKPVKAFICSTGKATPKSGTYKISNKYRWRSLFGGVYGQYAVRIHGNILFHSVPYEKMSANSLEYEEYDKLGTSASMGCIRLCVRDAKWIYDNAKAGSTVEFYSNSSNPGPLGKPKSQKISGNKENRNWDPTDPDKHNPWIGGDGKAIKVTVETNNSSTNYNKPNTNTTTAPITNSTTPDIPAENQPQENNTTPNSPTNLPEEQPPVNNSNTTTQPPTNTTVTPETPELPNTNITPSSNNTNNNDNSNTTTPPASTTPDTNPTTTPEPEPEPTPEPTTPNDSEVVETSADTSQTGM